jgi:mannosyl-3-phosphoglycerate phosphatase
LKTKVVIFADLDGTVVDNTYNFNEIQPMIRRLSELGTAIIFNSSKTLPEVEFYRKKLQINDPFIIENGSAIVIPKNYFSIPYQFTKQRFNYDVLELGMPYCLIREKLRLVASKNNAEIIGFGDMTVKEIADDTGLPLPLACFAKDREYDEAFKIISKNKTQILKAIVDLGLTYTKGGKYYHILGDTNKGKAVITLKGLYCKHFDKIVTIGIGDGQNDQPMLAVVDKSFIVKGEKKSSWEALEEAVQTYLYK